MVITEVIQAAWVRVADFRVAAGVMSSLAVVAVLEAVEPLEVGDEAKYLVKIC
jgi:hypothetical protein